VKFLDQTLAEVLLAASGEIEEEPTGEMEEEPTGEVGEIEERLWRPGGRLPRGCTPTGGRE
jgi:hypothetical protein